MTHAPTVNIEPITLTLTERQARYIRFAVQSDAEVLNNGDFEGEQDPHRVHDASRCDADAVIAMIDAALARRARR